MLEPEQDDVSEHNAGQSIDKTEAALDSVTDDAIQNHGSDPKQTLHQPAKDVDLHVIDHADHISHHSWMSKRSAVNALRNIEANFHLGNYVIDRSTREKHFENMSVYVRLGMHLLYYGSRQENILQWQKTEHILKAQTKKMGKEYDTPESTAHIAPFIKSFHLEDSMLDMIEPDPTKYKTFNEFFGRAIRPEARPIAEPDDTNVFSSPADCRLTAFQTIDLATKYWIKGYNFTIERLIVDPLTAKAFDQGSIVIARLAPQDYHRWHSPIDGIVENVYDIPGTYYTVNPQAINQEGSLNVFCQNRRSVMLVRQKNGSQVAIIAVGAMLVGSIKYVDKSDVPGTEIKRGQCLGAFYYGGSTVIVLYPKGEITIDEDIVKNSSDEKCETLVKTGWRIGSRTTRLSSSSSTSTS